MSDFVNLPPQQLSFSKKNKTWRKKHLDWANSKCFFNYSLVRKSVIHKKINYDLLNGKLHMTDMEVILNPEGIKAGYIPERIQHYPIMNSKLNVLRGEESKRTFDYRVIVTNPNAVSEIEDNKKNELYQRLQELISNQSISEDEFNKKLEELNDYFTYDWQDMKEIKANALLNHYVKELGISLIFNQGIMDALTVGEEIYLCDIVGGEPTIERVNPLKIRIFKSGYSNRVEDAEVIIIEDYWSPSKVIDTYYDVLSKKDMDYIENLPDYIGQAPTDSMDNIDERFGFVNNSMIGEELNMNGFYFNPLNLFADSVTQTLLPYDLAGNLRVLRMYWKSRRKIKKVKSYDPQTGEEVFNFYPENYILNTDLGEEEEIYWVNEAWEGTKIGEDIYVNMRPRTIQYNRISNPSRCHFGIIGTIYNLNESKPFSLVDMMKPYNYLYDVIHDRLNKAIARNWGKIIKLDLAMIPKGWEIEKWMYYAKTSGIAVVDSFNEGNVGASTGKLAGGLNNNSSGVIDADAGNFIQEQINLLEFIKNEMGEVAGISRQREGQISNRETVGGVERSNLQSSHITEWIFIQHEDLKKRVMECFLETAKIALKGRSKKFQYILPEYNSKIIDIDGDEFAECDYGLVVDNSSNTQMLASKIDSLAQAALQNQTLSFSTIMKLFNSNSLAEKERLVEKDEKAIQESRNKSQQEQLESNERINQQNLEFKQSELELKEAINIRDNETKLLIAQIGKEENIEEESDENLQENIRQFNEKLQLEKEKLNFTKSKHKDEIEVKKKQISSKKTSK